MKLYLRALVAILPGIFLCMSDSKIRRLAVWPWIIGAVCYLLSMFGAWTAHPHLVAYFVNDPHGIFGWLLFGVTWVAAAGVLLGASLILSVIVVQIFTSGFQSAIASHVLLRLGHVVPKETAAGLRGTFKDVVRTMGVESGKLLILVPCILLVFLLGFIPVLIPLAVLGTAWLLAYQFVDIVLDLYRIPVRERFRICTHRKVLLVCFGLGLTLLWAIPFAGMLLAPAAAAGSAWLLSDSRLLADIERASPAKIE